MECSYSCMEYKENMKIKKRWLWYLFFVFCNIVLCLKMFICYDNLVFLNKFYIFKFIVLFFCFVDRKYLVIKLDKLLFFLWDMGSL